MNFKEFKERLALAWRIIRDRDGNCVAHAYTELKAAGYFDGEPDGMNEQMALDVINLLRTFSTQGHSGFSANFARQLFGDLAAFKPIAPLTGSDDEWVEVHEGMFQNRRYSSVFKDGKDGRAYQFDAVIFEEPDGCCFTSFHSRQFIDFPYTPRSVRAKISKDAPEHEKKNAALAAWSAA